MFCDSATEIGDISCVVIWLLTKFLFHVLNMIQGISVGVVTGLRTRRPENFGFDSRKVKGFFSLLHSRSMVCVGK